MNTKYSHDFILLSEFIFYSIKSYGYKLIYNSLLKLKCNKFIIDVSNIICF